MGSIVNWTVNQLQAELKKKAVTAGEVLRQSLSRADEIKNLNAFVTMTSNLSEQQAREADARFARGENRPLEGVTIAVKDNFAVRGIKTTCGSRMLAEFYPPYTATAVQGLFDAGAILVGKTNLDEFGMGSGCVDSCHGPTKNSWNVNCVAGGSSGGSAVAVATGAVFGALGSDSGGSTRNPASYNGVVGLKPTYGRLSRWGLIPLVNSMDVPGILTRKVDDAAAFLNCLTGWDCQDSTTVQKEYSPICLPDSPCIEGLKVGVPIEYFTDEMSPEVVSSWKETVMLLSEGGADVKEVSMPNTKYSIACYSVLNQCEVASNMARYDGLEFGFRAKSNASTEQLYAQSRALGLGDVVRRRILCGNYFLLAENYDKYFTKALSVRRLIANDFMNVWKSGVDVLVTPVTLSDAPLLTEFLERDARAQSASQDYCTQPANMAGVPAIALPTKLSERGLPLSVQLMARNFNEDILLRVAKFIETEVCFHKHWAKILKASCR